jgi:hypothetical protein
MAGTPVTPVTPAKPRVIFAVYGGVRDHNPDDVPTENVTAKLQIAIEKSLLGGGPNSGHVKIDRFSMVGDPANGVVKSFGAIVEYPDGETRFFAGKENDTIDFS